MTKIVLDDSLRSKLNGFNEQVEVCDQAGQAVGHFVPIRAYKELLYAWLNAQVTDEELDRASREPGGRSLAEIWKSLGEP